MAPTKTMLITGASGFLGTWLAEAAHAQGFTLLGVDIAAPRRPELFAAFSMHPCDRVDYASLFADYQVSVVFHLAGAASVPQSVENPVGDFASLLPGTVCLLAYLTKHHPEVHLVMFSSAAVYGNPSQLPIRETDPLRPISPYGIHKAAAEFLIDHYARLSGLRASVLRIFSAYGEGLHKQVVWDLCQKVMLALRDCQSELKLHGTGDETRDFLHASDVARAALLVAEQPPATGTQVFNIASGVETSIRSLAMAICGSLGTNLTLTFTGAARAGDPVNWRADVSQLNELGFLSGTSLLEGVQRCVQWQRTLAANPALQQ